MTYTNNQQACLLMRLFLGATFLVSAYDKFHMGVQSFVSQLAGGFGHSMVPVAFAKGYGYLLPYVELVLGATLVLGIFTDVMLAVSAVTLLSLFVGRFVLGDGVAATQKAVFLFINMCAIRWFEHVAPSIDVITRKKKVGATSG